ILEKDFQETDTSEARQTVHEDMAVFRILLNRSIERAIGFPLRIPGHHVGQGGKEAFHDLAPAEGVYLKGHGIVYSLSAPPARDPLGKVAVSTVKELTEWERARLELRGQKAQENKPATPREVPLAETLLRLL